MTSAYENDTSYEGTPFENTTSSYENDFEEAMATYGRRRQELTDLQTAMEAISVTVTAPRKVVSVTVNSSGQVKDLKFPSSTYKNKSPAELSSIILKTIQDACTEAMDQAADLMSPMLPAGMDARQLMRGEVDLIASMPETFDELDEMVRSLLSKEG